MNTQKSGVLIGGLLILLGLLSLLDNLNYIYLESQLVVGLLFLAAAGFFFVNFAQKHNTANLILGAALAFIGASILLDSYRGFNDQYIGVLFLWMVAALFAYGFFRDARKWGFLIPAGFFFTIGCIVFLEAQRFFDDDLLGSVFFLGLGLTFGLLYFLKNEQNRLDWAKYPAAALTAFAGFLYVVISDSLAADLFFPVAMILTGAYLVYLATRTNSRVRNA